MSCLLICWDVYAPCPMIWARIIPWKIHFSCRVQPNLRTVTKPKSAEDVTGLIRWSNRVALDRSAYLKLTVTKDAVTGKHWQDGWCVRRNCFRGSCTERASVQGKYTADKVQQDAKDQDVWKSLNTCLQHELWLRESLFYYSLLHFDLFRDRDLRQDPNMGNSFEVWLDDYLA